MAKTFIFHGLGAHGIHGFPCVKKITIVLLGPSCRTRFSGGLFKTPYQLEINCPHSQWLFLVPLKGGSDYIIPQLAVYTTYIPRKKPCYFPLNPDCLMTGSLVHGL